MDEAGSSPVPESGDPRYEDDGADAAVHKDDQPPLTALLQPTTERNPTRAETRQGVPLDLNDHSSR
ncbi:MAG: hypothetical protein N2C14_26100, partial [Planctomycetales bacterium]